MPNETPETIETMAAGTPPGRRVRELQPAAAAPVTEGQPAEIAADAVPTGEPLATVRLDDEGQPEADEPPVPQRLGPDSAFR